MGRIGRKWFDEFLEKIGATSGTTYARLAHTAEFGEDQDRTRAIGYLGELQYSRAVGLLARLIQVEETGSPCRVPIFSNCCHALGRIDTAEAHRLLVGFYEQSADPWRRASAIDAMSWEAKFHDPALVIRAIRTDPYPQVREFGLFAVLEQVLAGNIAPYKDTLVESLNSRRPCIRAYAVDAVAWAGDERLLAMVFALKGDRGRCRSSRKTVGWHAKHALRDLGHPLPTASTCERPESCW